MRTRAKTGIWSPHFPFSPAKFPIFYGWVIILVGMIGTIASMPGQTIGFAAFTQPMMDALNLSETTLSFAYLLGTVGSGFLLPKGGRFANVVGLRKSMVFSCLAFGVVLFYMGFSDVISRGLQNMLFFFPESWIAFVVITIGFFFSRFLGQGMLTTISRNMMGKWFNARRGMVLAIAGIGTSIVFSLSPKILEMFVTSLGWRDTWLTIGVIMLLGMSVIAYLFFREDPEESGLEMDGGYKPDLDLNPNPELVIHHEYTLQEAKRDFSFWAFSLTLAWNGFFTTGYSFLAAQFALEMGVDESMVFNLFVPMAIVSVVVNLVGGVIADRTRLKYFLTLHAACLSVTVAGILLMPTTLGFVFLVGGMGICWGCFSVISNNVFPRFYGRLNLSEIGGYSMSVLVIACALGPFVFAIVKDFFGSYQPILYFSLVVPLALVAASFKADNPQRRLIEQEKRKQG